MTEHDATGFASEAPRRADLRVVGGRDVSGPQAEDPAGEDRTAAARAAHPSTGVGLPAVRRLRSVPAPPADEPADGNDRTRRTDSR